MELRKCGSCGDEECIDNGPDCDDTSASNDGGDDDPFRRPS